MMVKTKSFLLLILICIRAIFGIEGSECTTEGRKGICRIIDDCPRTLLKLSQGVLPQTCGFNDTEPIVCCVDDPSDGLPLFILGKVETQLKKKNETEFKELINSIFANYSHPEINLTKEDIRFSTANDEIEPIPIGARATKMCFQYRGVACRRPKPAKSNSKKTSFSLAVDESNVPESQNSDSGGTFLLAIEESDVPEIPNSNSGGSFSLAVDDSEIPKNRNSRSKGGIFSLAVEESGVAETPNSTSSGGNFSLGIDDSDDSGESYIVVVGGELSLAKEFKGAAAVGSDMGNGTIKWYCGGSLISEYYVLTAAHCVYNAQWGAATWVRLGDLNLVLDNDDARPKDYKIVKRIKHPSYKKPYLYHDIALLVLEGPVEFNDYVRPACLSYYSFVYNPHMAIAIGWGKANWADEEGSNDLLKVQISVLPHENCSKFYTDEPNLKNGIIEEFQMCAGDEGKDTCQGDSGGGLIINGNGCLQYVIGVTSFGKYCGSIVPAVYTRVSPYIDWIEKIVWPNVTFE